MTDVLLKDIVLSASKNVSQESFFTTLQNRVNSAQRFKHQPEQLKKYILQIFHPYIDNLIINGPFEQRILLFSLQSIKGHILYSPNMAIRENPFFINNQSSLDVKDPSLFISECNISKCLLNKLEKPHVKLVALYHPENFPLPRFALGISDMARAIREEFLGQVTLNDMQLGESIDSIIQEIRSDLPDIVGISATFGQHDVLEAFMTQLNDIKNYDPFVVFGGSLAALNCEKLVTKYPKTIVGLGPGEPTMQDVMYYWLGEKKITDIDNIMFLSTEGVTTRTFRLRSPPETTGIPELDLLEPTLENRGVMQLESTRGCSYACSFCPRAHKGVWTPQSINLIEKLLPEISAIYEKHPKTARKIFLVDEEFVGYKADEITIERVLSVCDTLEKYGFTFETSARVDQVYRRNRDREWHIDRIKLWRYLVENGLDRVLFGVESGVDTILERFNKKTTKQQNENAIRILSSFSIPVRLTYITFDPLMSMEELVESYVFQGRKDLLLKPRDDLSEGELFDGIHDQNYLQKNSQGRRLYQEISYLLVSMECLIGSKYLAKVEELGLAREYNYLMGKRNAEFLDKRIGMLSHYAQLWVDRNFALDYTIKSIEKVAHKTNRTTIRALRGIVKDYAYSLLAQFLAVVNQRFDLIPEEFNINILQLKALSKDWHGKQDSWNEILTEIMDHHFANLVYDFYKHFEHVKHLLIQEDHNKIEQVLNQWKSKSEWRLINAA